MPVSYTHLDVYKRQGVGEEQAKACRACKNFGAAISAVPGKLGNVYPDPVSYTHLDVYKRQR